MLVSANASNMLGAAKFTGWKHLPCFAHTLNLVVTSSIARNEELSKVIRKVKKKIVTFFPFIGKCY